MNLRNLLYKLRSKPVSFSQAVDWISRYANYHLGSSGEGLSPLRVFINLNSVCNARCRMCDVGLHNKRSLFHKIMVDDGSHELDIGRLDELFLELKGIKPLIAFNGVEPTLYKHLIRAVRSAKGHGMEVQLTTNGILLPKLADGLFDAGIDIVWVSLDGPENVHDEIRGVEGGFKKAIEGMRILDARKKSAGGKRPSVNIAATIFHMNQSSIHGLLSELARSGIKIDEVMIQHLQFVDMETTRIHNRKFPKYPVTEISIEGSDPKEINLDRLHEEVLRVKAAGFPLNIRWKPPLYSLGTLEAYYRRPEVFIGDSYCRVFWTELQVLADGSVTGSQRCYSLELGNINETSFLEIWNGEKMKRLRRFLKKEGALPACSRCCSIL